MSGSPARKFVAVSLVIAVVALLIPFGVSCSKPPKPTAAFTFSYVSGELLIDDPIAGLAPLTVQFTDQSSGEITSWRWNFGDGPSVEGGQELKDVTHTYKAPNSSGYIVVLTVRGPGGKNEQEKIGVVTVFSCSEAANAELNQARQAVRDCLEAADRTTLDAEAPAWDGSRGIVMVAGMDAADYLGVWKTFKATYDVALDGTIDYGTDKSWGCVFWNPTALGGSRWTANT